ncbi:hypothetical protein DFO70_12513 [Cytobacillus firmus]|uniref:Uncharacterized protein n=2 Tax=Cytobacillus TaxID=2675230 RepID=A0A366JJE4_CYTFI|nr:hypothetical protein DFO70_12513 [Cytobacillus firmus]TDX39287.1 hypothetical protein DFO72_111117 [Cytobacillus oceanisediminis]
MEKQMISVLVFAVALTTLKYYKTYIGVSR